MKKIITLTLIAAWAILPQNAPAAEASVYTDFLSAYVIHGQIWNDEPVFQPGVDVAGPWGLGYSFWANMDLSDSDTSQAPNTAGKWNEINFGLNWTLPWEGPVSLTLEGIYLAYPNSGEQAEEDAEISADGGYEVAVTLAAEDLPLAPSVKFMHTTSYSEDWIATFSIGHSLEVSDQLSLDLGAAISYAGRDYMANVYGSEDGSALANAEVNATLNYAVTEQFTVSLLASFSSILDSDVRDSIEESEYFPEVDFFYGGISLGYTF